MTKQTHCYICHGEAQLYLMPEEKFICVECYKHQFPEKEAAKYLVKKSYLATNAFREIIADEIKQETYD